MLTPQSRRTTLRRIVAGILATVGVAAALLVAGSPAQADPPYAKPDFDILECYPFDDPVNYGDGIDWYRLKLTYKNIGYTASKANMDVQVWSVWNGVENSAPVTFEQGPMVRNQTVTQYFWITSSAVYSLDYGARVDAHGDVSESNENNNLCLWSG